MKRRGFILNATVIVLIIPLLILAAVYEGVSSSIMQAQSQNLLLSKDTFAISTVKQDFQNALDLSLKRAYLTLTDYVIANGLLTGENASYALRTLILTGTLGGVPQPNMANVTLKDWFGNIVSYFSSQGLKIYPSNFSAFESHVELIVAPLDSFHLVAMARITNVTIEDSSGRVMYSGNIPEAGYIYSTVDVIGFEDPFLPASLNGLYTRVIQPCSIPYPGPVYGYYDINNFTELVMGWCYLGVNATGTYNGQTIYYPTILNRFEKVPYTTYVARQQAYAALATKIQQTLGINMTLPVGLITFLSPSEDKALFGAIQSLELNIPPDYDSVSYYFINCAVLGHQYCIPGSRLNTTYSLQLDNVTRVLVFNTTG